MAKYEIAAELGLLDKVLEYGWKSLTSKETGRIGGMVTKRKRTGRMSEGVFTKPVVFGTICTAREEYG